MLYSNHPKGMWAVQLGVEIYFLDRAIQGIALDGGHCCPFCPTFERRRSPKTSSLVASLPNQQLLADCIPRARTRQQGGSLPPPQLVGQGPVRSRTCVHVASTHFCRPDCSFRPKGRGEVRLGQPKSGRELPGMASTWLPCLEWCHSRCRGHCAPRWGRCSRNCSKTLLKILKPTKKPIEMNKIQKFHFTIHMQRSCKSEKDAALLLKVTAKWGYHRNKKETRCSCGMHASTGRGFANGGE